MPLARKKLVSLDATPYYHCVSRCVRRAFLCGEDKFTSQSYEHRRGWIEQRLLFLSEIFAIDLCAYAVMSNHYHVVLHINKTQAKNWSLDEVIQRWHQLFKGHTLFQRYLRGETRGKAEKMVLFNDIETWRQRLCDMSWFMVAPAHPCAQRHLCVHAHRAVPMKPSHARLIQKTMSPADSGKAALNPKPYWTSKL